MQPEPPALALWEVVLHPHRQGGTDPGEGVDQDTDECPVAEAEQLLCRPASKLTSHGAGCWSFPLRQVYRRARFAEGDVPPHLRLLRSLQTGPLRTEPAPLARTPLI